MSETGQNSEGLYPFNSTVFVIRYQNVENIWSKNYTGSNTRLLCNI